MTHAYFRGPLPPPNVLEQFERAHRGAAERIFVMANAQAHEREQKRAELERARMGTPA